MSHLMLEGQLVHGHHSVFEIVIREWVKAFSFMMMPWAVPLTVLGGLVGLLFQKYKHKVEETKVAKERLSYLLTSSPAVIYSSKPSGDFGATFISENIIDQLGYEPRHFTEDSNFWLQHIHPDDRDRVISGLSLLFDQNHHTHEYRFLDKTGAYKWMRDELRLIRDEEGKPLEIIGSWADISELKYSQEKLQDSHDNLEHRVKQRTAELEKVTDEINRKNIFLKSIFESLPYPFYVIDVHNYLLKMANSKVATNEKWKGKTCYALTHHRETPCETSEHGCPLEIVKRTGKLAVIEHLHFDENNVKKHMEVHGYPIFDDQNNIAEMIEFAIDISERKNQEAEKEKLIGELQQALEQIKTLSGIVPICMHCKGIRDDKGYWKQLEKYISDHSDVQFSHSICDKCLKKHYPEEAN